MKKLSQLKFLITLLSSSNEKLLKLVYNTVLNQKKHNLNYTILIVVNSLNQDYYNDVCKEFKSYNVEIIQTQSNGKPGMGHNSLFEIFRYRKEYDYLISVDGDDFLYPYALHQLSKCFKKNQINTTNSDDHYVDNSVETSIDCVCIYGNDTIRDYNSPFDKSDIYLNNHFYLRMGYNIPKTFSESDLLINPFTYDINNGVQTIIRFIMCSRNFVDRNINNELYCEKSHILDDYRFYLNFVDNILNKNINGLIINSDHIYLYNNMNHNSVSKTQHIKFNDDYKIIINYLNDFIHLKYLIDDWNLDFINYKQLTPVFNENLELVCNSNGSYSLNKEHLEIKKNYIYLIDFANNIAIDYYKLCLKNIENYLFTDVNKKNAYELCLFLVNNKIIDNKLFIYMAICYYYNNDTVNTLMYIEKAKYMISKYKVLEDFYNINKNK